MAPGVFGLVLLGAALHASWNAIVKESGDTFLAALLVGACAGLLAAVLVPFLPLPAAASWPFLGTSVLLQVLYLLLLIQVYRRTDLSLGYPVMRGAAPLLLLLANRRWIGERLPPAAWLGITAVALGIFGLALGSRGGRRRGLAWALANAGVIAAYTLVDGLGVRRSGAPVAYTLWIFLLTAVPLMVWAWMRRRAGLGRFLARNWGRGLAGGVGTTASYGLALWAMTLAPVAMVAALRETSILFGVLLSRLVLKERPGAVRWAAAGLIALGAVALKLA